MQVKTRGAGRRRTITIHSDAETILELAARLPPGERERLRLGALEIRAERGPLPAGSEHLLNQLIGALAGAGDDEALEARLIDKLAAAGQLRPGYLMRALEQKRLGLFVKALARLGDYYPEAVARAVDSRERPELLALALAGVGIDRSAFPTILDKVRAINAGAPGGGEAGSHRAMGAFADVPKEVAAEAFRRASAA